MSASLSGRAWLARLVSPVFLGSFSLALVTGYAMPTSALASPRGSYTLGVYAEAGNCFGYYTSLNFGIPLSSRVRLNLGYERFFERSRDFKRSIFNAGNTPVIGLKWLTTDAAFSPFVGASSMGLVQMGLDYLSAGGFNLGVGAQSGTCIGLFLFIGKYF